MLPILQIGPLALPVPQLSVLITLWLGITLAERHVDQHGMKVDELYNLVFTGLVTGIIGARLGYAIQSLSAFIQSPLSIFSLNTGMLDPFSGCAAALLGFRLYSQRKNISFWDTLDALTPILSVLAIGLSIAHLASGESFGSETNLPWSINLWGVNRHPTQFYELFASTAIFCMMIPIFGNRGKNGTQFLAFLCLTSATILFLEG